AINVNNAASVAAGTNACGQSRFVAPSVSPSISAALNAPSRNIVANRAVPSISSVSNAPGVGGAGGFGAGPSNFVSPGQGPSSNISSANVPSAPFRSNVPSVSAAAVAVPSKNVIVVPKAVISNTGPNSSNKISTEVSNKVTVTNTNTIKVTNT